MDDEELFKATAILFKYFCRTVFIQLSLEKLKRLYKPENELHFLKPLSFKT